MIRSISSSFEFRTLIPFSRLVVLWYRTPGLSNSSRWNLGPESPQRVTTNYQTRLGGGHTLRIARLRLAGGMLLLGGDQDRSRGRHTEIDGHRA